MAKSSSLNGQKKIILTVTNDLTYDQRMQRICTSLAQNGYNVLLVGRRKKTSLPLHPQLFRQKRLFMFAENGKLFYLEYNLRLFFFLLFTKMDAVCAIDLDTIFPCLYASKIKKIIRVYDAHELFSEMKEVVSRPKIHAFWLWVEKKTVPQFYYGYTVNHFIVEELERRYGVHYGLVRNLPVRDIRYELQITNYEKQYSLANSNPQTANLNLPTGNFFLYQGAVNEGRGFETLIPAMQFVNAPLVIAGDGNFMGMVKELIAENNISEKVILLGSVTPNILKTITPQAYTGITIFESTGLNQYYSLANRFFDYFNGGIPQLCVNYPEYASINAEYDIALLIPDIKTQTISTGMNNLLADHVLYNRLKNNCDNAAKNLCWENEQIILLAFWANVFRVNK